MNGFEALRGAYRNHLGSEEERMVSFFLSCPSFRLHTVDIKILQPFQKTI